MFQEIACHGPHSRPGKGSWLQEENHHTRKVVGGRSTVHEYHLDIIHAFRRDIWRVANALRTADFYWCLKLQKDGLIDEDFSGFCTEVFDFVLLQLNGLSGSVPSHCDKKVSSANEMAWTETVRGGQVRL